VLQYRLDLPHGNLQLPLIQRVSSSNQPIREPSPLGLLLRTGSKSEQVVWCRAENLANSAPSLS
jgi:hypothetical protein